jgi:XRE family transcriptional regulator, regulator of sulfur utilization
MNLGKSIQDIRKQKGLTQTEFAKKSGITQTYLSQIENNHKEPNLSILKSISEILEVPLPIIFYLAMEENDVEIGKREAFNIVSPSINSLVNEFFAV